MAKLQDEQFELVAEWVFKGFSSLSSLRTQFTCEEAIIYGTSDLTLNFYFLLSPTTVCYNRKCGWEREKESEKTANKKENEREREQGIFKYNSYK